MYDLIVHMLETSIASYRSRPDFEEIDEQFIEVIRRDILEELEEVTHTERCKTDGILYEVVVQMRNFVPNDKETEEIECLEQLRDLMHVAMHQVNNYESEMYLE